MIFPWVKCSLVIASVGVIIAICGGMTGLFVFPKIIDDQIKEYVKLKPGSDAMERWLEIPQPLHFKIYFFHVLNPEEVMNGGRMRVEERGPYIYEQRRTKTLVVTDKDTDEHTFIEAESQVFNKEASSPLDETDTLTIVNTPLVALTQISEEKSSTERTYLNKNIHKVFPDSGKSLFHTVRVKDILFDGYKMCPDYPNWSWIGVNTIAKTVCKMIDKLAPMTVVRQADGSYKFSFFNHKNITNYQYFAVKTGITNFKEVGQFTRYNYSEYLPFWNGQESKCNEIKGTDATIFPPKVSRDDKIFIYNKDVCRVFEINYLKDVVYKGIRGYRFRLNKKNLEAPSQELGTDCYCTKGTMDIEGKPTCMKDGALDLYTCHGAPIILTLPHLYQASDDYISNSAVGFEPDQELHETFVDLQPDVGFPLRGAKRIQLNVMLRPVAEMDLTQKVKPALAPILWLDEGIELNDEMIDMINEEYFDVKQILNYVVYGVIGVGILIFVSSMFNFCYHQNKKYEGHPVTT